MHGGFCDGNPASLPPSTLAAELVSGPAIAQPLRCDRQPYLARYSQVLDSSGDAVESGADTCRAVDQEVVIFVV